MLQAVYAARGLTPYTDYGFVYPPGFAWLYGKLLRLQDPASVITAMDFVRVLLVFVCAGQLMRLARRRRRLLGGALLLIVGGVVPLSSGIFEPVILVAIAMLVMMEIMTRGVSAVRAGMLAAITAMGTLLRWDWMLFAACIEVGGAGVVFLAAPALRLEAGEFMQVRRMAARLLWAAVAALLGIVLADAAVLGYAMAIGSWPETKLFAFGLPVFMLPYRRLPVPMPVDARSLQWLVDVCAMGLISLAALLACISPAPADHGRPAKSWAIYVLEWGALLAPCVALLPYTFTRADFFHFIPLTILLMVMIPAAFALWPLRSSVVPLVIALFITSVPCLDLGLKSVLAYGMPREDLHMAKTRADTIGCTHLFPPNARSLFVGQVSYARYLFNFPVVYLMRPDLRPATPFISDEPGIQNSCRFGAVIASDLVRAPRPLVLVLDSEPWSPEANLTRTMTSCGKIEGAVASMAPVFLGACQMSTGSSERDFHVMVVR